MALEVFPSGTVVRRGFAAESSLDRLEKITEHGTKAGYDQGCRGSRCPGVAAVGMSCSQANTRFAGDASYRRRVQAGMSAAAIFEDDRLDGTVVPKLNDRAAERAYRAVTSAADSEDFDEVLDEPRSARAVDVRVSQPRVADVVPREAVPAAEMLPAPLSPDASPDAASAPQPGSAKWAVRKVWTAIAVDGTIHGPFDSHMEAVAFVGDQLAPELRKSVAAMKPALKRVRRTWTDGDTKTMLDLHAEGLSASEIARRLGRLPSVLVVRLRMAGLEPNGKRVDES